MGMAPKTITVLFADRAGPYVNRDGVDAWTKERDAMKYRGDNPVVTHSDCSKWGKFAKVNGLVAQDGGQFQFSLETVRRCGGVLEHVEGSLAWKLFDLPMPPAIGWSKPDKFGGRSCLVYQGHYGHRAPKATWLYAVLPAYPELKWGKTPMRDLSHLSPEMRKRAIKTGICQRLSKNQRKVTPEPFAKLLLEMAAAVHGVGVKDGES